MLLLSSLLGSLTPKPFEATDMTAQVLTILLGNTEASLIAFPKTIVELRRK